MDGGLEEWAGARPAAGAGRRRMSRITRALLLLGALALLAPAGARPRRRSCRSGASTPRSTSPRRRATRTRVFVVERGGTIQVVRNGDEARRAVPRPHAARSTPTGERGLLSMAFAPDYATSGLFYVYLVARAADGRDPDPRVPALGRPNPDRADPATERIVLPRDAQRGRQPQRRPDRSSGPTAACGRAPATAAAATTSPQPRAGPREPARQAAADRPAARQRADYASRPTTRSAPRSGPTACATRSASRSTAGRATS